MPKPNKDIITPNYNMFSEESTEEWEERMGIYVEKLKSDSIRIFETGRLESLASDLSYILYEVNINMITRYPESMSVILDLYNFIGQTRDIRGGRGEYSMAYMMIYEWYHYFPELAKHAVWCFVHELDCDNTGDASHLPYGSWKDIKYLCNYVRRECGQDNHELIQYCIELATEQLRIDEANYKSMMETARCDKLKISLLARWIPRESKHATKFGWLYEKFATAYFPEYLSTTGSSVERKERAVRKCKTQYRLLCTKLNRYLDTIQIKQCGGEWSQIDHSKTTSITLHKQLYALTNTIRVSDENGEPSIVVRSQDLDRIVCADNFNNYVKNGGKTNSAIKVSKTRYLPLEKYCCEYLNKMYLQSASFLETDAENMLKLSNEEHNDNQVVDEIIEDDNEQKFQSIVDLRLTQIKTFLQKLLDNRVETVAFMNIVLPITIIFIAHFILSNI